MMMKILSILPGFVGFLCIGIMIGSIVGFSTEEVVNDIPIVPCSEDEDIGCRVAMTTADIEVPRAFNLLEIEISVEWEESERSWFGVIQQYDELCEPDNNGLTNCTEVEFEEYIIAGGSNSDGELKFKMDLVNSDLFEDQEVFKLIQISALFISVSSFGFCNEVK